LPLLIGERDRRKIVRIGGVPSAFAAKAATTTIPIVFLAGEDPVKLGLVASLARPGGNLTGINVFGVELAAKRFELLRQLVPGATRIAVLVDPANAAGTESTLKGMEAAVGGMWRQIQVLNASTIGEIDAASRQRGSVAARGAGAAEGNAGDRAPRFITRRFPSARIPPRLKGGRLTLIVMTIRMGQLDSKLLMESWSLRHFQKVEP
jgi:hypothetical protein